MVSVLQVRLAFVMSFGNIFHCLLNFNLNQKLCLAVFHLESYLLGS